MKNKKALIISSIACLFPIAIGLIFYSQLPEQIPIHWNATGEIDNYANKPIALFGFPFGLLLMHIFVLWAMDKDPKYQNIPKVMYTLMYCFIPILTNFICCFTINAALPNGLDINITKATSLFIGILFLFIGNYLPKCKQSYTVGIKTPWALDDEENWNKTHRLAGFIWSITGLMMLLTIFLPAKFMMAYILILVFIMGFIPYIYSYFLYRKKKGR
ncbi:MAG: DUF1648 domain-containing protein [Erysipelotrichia bacterium]|nr:DUF1648 domain-containing protein [Erysipelotrichia bacterium]NCC54331.1 DUF1648 domain-containing protein [Erysipelotrichia bacterium]